MKAYIIGFLILAASVWLTLWFSSSAPGESFVGPQAHLTAEEQEASDHISAAVEALAQDIGPRGTHTQGSLEEVDRFLQQEFRHMRLEPTEIALDCGGTPGKAYEVMFPGRALARETIVLAAHLDSAAGSPGADDDASGCAVLLEVLQELSSASFDRTLRVVFWTAGAAPLAGTDKSSASAYAERLRARHEKVAAVLCFDSLGTYSDAAGTQEVPFPFGFSFPDRGDFLAFVGDWSSHGVMDHALEQFRASCQFPSQALSLPSFFDFVSLSDDGAFRSAGYPALRVTDTGSLRNSAAGTKADVVGRLDYVRMARVAVGLTNTVVNLAKRTTPLL